MFRFLTLGLVALLPLSLVLPLQAGDKKTDEKEFKVEGRLSDDDPKDKVLKNSPSKTYDYKMVPGKIYVIDLKSKSFDAYLRLEDPKGKQVAFNDDASESTLDSRIVYKATKAGEFKIFATCLDGKAGEFTLTVRLGTAEELAKFDPHSNLLNKAAPEIEGVFTHNGRTKKLSDLKGKVVLIDFWAVWCGPCIATFPHLREWSEKYKKDGLEILGVTTYYEVLGFDKDKGQVTRLKDKKLEAAEENDMVKDFAAHHKLTHQLMTITKDAMKQAGTDYGVRGIPQAVLIDRQGNVRMVRVGSGPANAAALQEEIGKLLREK